MATTYHFREGYALPYVGPGMCVLKRNLDVPALIALGAEPNGLYVSDVATALATTGFAATDILQIFRVPAGFHVITGGVRITTVGTDNIDIGIQTAAETLEGNADVDYWLNAGVITAATCLVFDHADGDAYNAIYQDVFLTNGSINVVFNTSAEAALIADFWVVGCKVW